MYLSCNVWERGGVLKDIDVQFHNSGAVLFGVPVYVPALMEYVERYNAHLNFESKLVAIDGPAKIATFEQKTRRYHHPRRRTFQYDPCRAAAGGARFRSR